MFDLHNGIYTNQYSGWLIECNLSNNWSLCFLSLNFWTLFCSKYDIFEWLKKPYTILWTTFMKHAWTIHVVFYFLFIYCGKFSEKITSQRCFLISSHFNLMPATLLSSLYCYYCMYIKRLDHIFMKTLKTLIQSFWVCIKYVYA